MVKYGCLFDPSDASIEATSEVAILESCSSVNLVASKAVGTGIEFCFIPPSKAESGKSLENGNMDVVESSIGVMIGS